MHHEADRTDHHDRLHPGSSRGVPAFLSLERRTQWDFCTGAKVCSPARPDLQAVPGIHAARHPAANRSATAKNQRNALSNFRARFSGRGFRLVFSGEPQRHVNPVIRVRNQLAQPDWTHRQAG